MSESMIERVARAIFKIAPDEAISRPSMLAARAAIAAMDPPTEAMRVAALSATFDEKRGGDHVYVGDVPIIWSAMIRECLK